MHLAEVVYLRKYCGTYPSKRKMLAIEEYYCRVYKSQFCNFVLRNVASSLSNLSMVELCNKWGSVMLIGIHPALYVDLRRCCSHVALT